MKRQANDMKVFIYVLFLLSANVSSAQKAGSTTEQKINFLQGLPGFTSASIGIAVKDNRSGEILYVSEPQLSMAPASILKLVTTATALEMLGADFRFQTIMSVTGTIRHDTLLGDLRIMGGGDPTLGSGYFTNYDHFMEDWISALKMKNIKVITGNLIIDGSIYDSQTIPDTWIWEDIGNYYGAGVSGINLYDNLYEVHMSSDKEPGRLTTIKYTRPEIPGLEFTNEVISSNINSDQAYIFGSPMEYKRVIRGTIPKGKGDFVIKGAVPDPSALLAHEFRKVLKNNEIVLSGESKYEKIKEQEGTILLTAVHQSPPLRDIIKVTNHESVNLFAESCLKQMAFKKTGLGSTEEGCKIISEYWKEKGIDMTGFYMCDGSGLSRFNAVTSMQMVDILRYMKMQSKWSADFTASLATAGQGTLTAINNESFPNQSLRAKSGSMTRVRCLAGYLETISGRKFSYSVMLNNFACSQREAGKRIEELLVEWRKL